MARKKPVPEFSEPSVESVRAEWEKRYQELMQASYTAAKETASKLEVFKTKAINLEHQAIGYRAIISYLENVIERTIKD